MPGAHPTLATVGVGICKDLKSSIGGRDGCMGARLAWTCVIMSIFYSILLESAFVIFTLCLYVWLLS